MHHAHQYLGQGFFTRVIGTVGGALLGLVVFDVLGAHRRAHKDEVVLKIAAVQNFGGDRIEEGFGQFGLVVVHQQADVVQLDLLPDVHTLLTRLELALQPLGAFFDPQVIELDALALGALLAVPVCRFKPVLGSRRLGSEQPVVAVKTIHHRLGYVVGYR